MPFYVGTERRKSPERKASQSHSADAPDTRLTRRTPLVTATVTLPLTGREDTCFIGSSTIELKVQPFVDPNPFLELTFSTVIAAKLAIAEYLARPLAKLTSEQMAYIDRICTNTLDKREVMKQVRDFFNPLAGTNNAE
ncbi:MAG: hypothetical protein PUP93_20600 [Rhizonema sp. NSF051]|nr:hypothetical protein [Rhizonema sp. NSF051]